MRGTWRGKAMAGPTTAGTLLEPCARARYPVRLGVRRVARPLIGISSYGRAGQRQTFPVPREYVDVVRLAGGGPNLQPGGRGGSSPTPPPPPAPPPPGGGATRPRPPRGG